MPQLTIYLYVLSNVTEGTEDTITNELTTLDAVLLNHVVGIPEGGSKVILMAVRNEEVLGVIDLGVLIISKANISSLLGIFLLLLLGEVGSLHLFDYIVGLLGTFCDIKGAGDNIFEGVSLPMTYTLIGSLIISNNETIGANETEDTCHDTEGGRTIVRVDDNNLRTLIGGGESIEEVTVGEANTVLREGSLLVRLTLGESIGNFIALRTESVNYVGGSELTVLLSTSGGVVGLEHLRATSSDFGIGKCEHVFVSFYLLEVSVSFSGSP